MSPADPSRRAEATSADILAVAVDIGDAAAIRMEMASVRRRLGELRNEQASLEAALAAFERQLAAIDEQGGVVARDLLDNGRSCGGPWLAAARHNHVEAYTQGRVRVSNDIEVRLKRRDAGILRRYF